MSGNGRPSQGLRLNGGKKFQILRAFNDEEANTFVVFGKIVRFLSELFYNCICTIIIAVTM